MEGAHYWDTKPHYWDIGCRFGSQYPYPGLGVELLAFLPEVQLFRLRAALTARLDVAVADTLDGPGGLSAVLDSRQVDLVVIDPADRRIERQTGELITIVERYSWIPTVLYTSPAGSGMRPAWELLRRGVAGLMLVGTDDHPSAIRSLVERVTTNRLAERFLSAIERPLAHLPENLQRAVRELVGAPHHFASVERIADAGAVTRRHLSRLLTSVGLTSAWEILVCARVLRAYQLLQSRSMTVEGTARRLELEPRVLSRHIRVATHLGSARDLRALSQDDLVTRCVALVYRPPREVRRVSGGFPSA